MVERQDSERRGSPSSPGGSPSYSDRFIPSRTGGSFAGSISFRENHHQASHSKSKGSHDREDSSATYTSALRAELFGERGSTGCAPSPGRFGNLSPIHVPSSPVKETPSSPPSPPRSLLHFRHDAAGASPSTKTAPESPFSLSPVGADPCASPFGSSRRAHRRVARTPFKVLDAPSLTDDFYLNLVDWSPSNILAVGLGNTVYLWNAHTSNVTKLCDFGDNDGVCSVRWAPRGHLLGVGSVSGKVQVWDCAKGSLLRTMSDHRCRVGCLDWAGNTLTSGSKDKSILLRDVRSPESCTKRLSGHRAEVCGLLWSPDERELASGGNDNQLFVWSRNNGDTPSLQFNEHVAAVKAIAWSPHQHGVLASGGGTADRCIRFWNTASGSPLSCVDTGSQVCNLAWSKNVNELVSTHGYSQNQICLWRYPSMSKVATLTGHTLRVLYLSVSPDGETIVTGAGDETLRFWSAFPSSRRSSNSERSSSFSTASPGSTFCIR